MKQVGKREKYEVFVDSVNGSDVCTFDTLPEAKTCARNWAKELITAKKLAKHESVVILKVVEEIVFEIKGEDYESNIMQAK